MGIAVWVVRVGHPVLSKRNGLAGPGDRLEIGPLLPCGLLPSGRSLEIQEATLGGSILRRRHRVRNHKHAPDLDSLSRALTRLEHNLVDNRIDANPTARQHR